MTEIKVELYECGNCHSIFSVFKTHDVKCCPECEGKNLTCQATGILTDVVEH